MKKEILRSRYEVMDRDSTIPVLMGEQVTLLLLMIPLLQLMLLLLLVMTTGEQAGEEQDVV